MICLTTSVGALRLKLVSMTLIALVVYSLNQSLVNPHLISIPGLGTFTTRSLASRDGENLGWQADWSLDAEVLGFGAVNQLRAHLLQSFHIAAGEGDSDLVDLLLEVSI
jgi:nucleoid DNA-binding protein